MYVGVSCPGDSGAAKPPGWAVSIFGGLQGDSTFAAFDLHGPLVLDKTSQLWLGADTCSTESAELSAIAECFLWLLREAPGAASLQAHIFCTSQEMCDLVTGKQTATEGALMQCVKILFAEVSKVRGISFKVGTGGGEEEHAELLAQKAAIFSRWGKDSKRWMNAVKVTASSASSSVESAQASQSPRCDDPGCDVALRGAPFCNCGLCAKPGGGILV